MSPTAAGIIKVIGGKKNFWLYSENDGYDLTHPLTPTAPPIYPRMPLHTTRARIAVDPYKTALVIVDMQNYFLSPALGRPSDAPAMKAVDNLIKHVIPACREAEMQIAWLSWGFWEKEIDNVPPAIVKGFAADSNFHGHRKIGGLGSDIGPVRLEDGSVLDGGEVLTHFSWNQKAYTPLEALQEENDILVSRTHMSGFGTGTSTEWNLSCHRIKTLIFAGANLDQCVGATIQDAVAKGYDCLLLKDATATTSPAFARQCIDYNMEEGWGFVLTCHDLVKGVEEIETEPVAKS